MITTRLFHKARDLHDFAVHASDAEAGRFDDFYFSDADWKVRYFVLDPGAWLPGRRLLVSPRSVHGVDAEASRIELALSQEELRGAPAIEEGRLPAQGPETGLLSSMEIEGYKVQGTDGLIGTLEDFVLDPDDWSVRYLVVDAGRQLSGRRALLSTASVHEVRRNDPTVSVRLSLDAVREAPEYDPKARFGAEEGDRLDAYYRRR